LLALPGALDLAGATGASIPFSLRFFPPLVKRTSSF
jgi:hypothetical protein